ncbi:MAG: hypothetical protein M1840_001782 [Geoglossum simile]|nr:MAG: hypothetical protein M1840_001782 [Geoglossum simile]
MASSPPKRRKTSLTTSIPIENATPQAERPAAIDAPHTAPGRASFLSPTKASLARFNPGLLERPRSAGGEGLRDREKSSDMSAVESPTTANGIGKEATNGNDSVPEAAHVAQEVAEERNGERSPSPHETVASSTRITRSTSKQGLRASPRRRSRTPSVVASPPPDQTWEPLATVSESESQIVQGNGDPQPQSEGDREGPVFKALQALAQLDGANDEREPEEPEEPELPPTPSQLGLEDSVMSKPPAGLLNTPSKRPRRNRALGEALKSSPTKVLPTRRLAISPARDAALRFTRQNLESETMGIRKRRRELPGVGEQAERDGASSSKRRKRDVLREQLRKLQDEVAMYEKQAELARKAGDGDGQLPIDLTNEEERGKLM